MSDESVRTVPVAIDVVHRQSHFTGVHHQNVCASATCVTPSTDVEQKTFFLFAESRKFRQHQMHEHVPIDVVIVALILALFLNGVFMESSAA